MTNAADLPVGSVVATVDTVYIKADHSDTFHSRHPWVGTTSNSRVHTNREITALLDSGATVLRVGDGA